MATFRTECIAAIACLLLTLGHFASARYCGHGILYNPQGHPTQLDDTSLVNLEAFSFNSKDWLSAISGLFSNIGVNSDIDESQFQIRVSMVGFTKDEVSVRVKDGFVVITGKHEPSSDDKAVATDNEDSNMQLTYKYALPEDTIVEEMKSRMTKEGVIIVSAPRSGVKKVDTKHEVPVQTDKENEIPIKKKHNEFYDEDSTETTTQKVAEGGQEIELKFNAV